MKQFEMDCYEVTESDDGGMRNNHVAFVATIELADKIVDKSKGWRSHSKYKKLITIFDTIEEVDANSKSALRKAGLAKLSAAEKEALGL